MKKKKTIKTQRDFINPFRKKDLLYWARKWKVRMDIIKDAMDVTGSARVLTIKNLLSRLNYITPQR